MLTRPWRRKIVSGQGRSDLEGSQLWKEEEENTEKGMVIPKPASKRFCPKGRGGTVDQKGGLIQSSRKSSYILGEGRSA